tara:strand:+ start:12406 stop:13026 length:621 start_codon:yes stop_codon:yes gene_type:complete
MKKCPDGQYYCNTDKKCKKIPRGYFVGRGGYLKSDPEENGKKKNGNGNGNGNGKTNGSTNGNGSSNGHSNGGNGGNGGANGGGGIGESKTFTQFLENVKIEHIDGSSTTIVDIVKPEPLVSPKNNIQYTIPEKTTYVARKTGKIIHVYLAWRGKNYMLQMFFPQIKIPSRREVQDQVRKVYPNAKLWNYQVSEYDPGEPLLQTGGK